MKELNLRRLRSAMKHSTKTLSYARRERIRMVEQYVGKHYAANGSSKAVPLNLIELAVNTYMRFLVARNPKALVKTKHARLMSSAATYGLAVNHLINEINLADSLSRVALNAIFSVGIGKIGICRGQEVEINGFLHDIGQPFFDSVDIDDWVHDTSANVYEQIQFSGNRYRIPYEYAMELDMFDKKARAKLRPNSKRETKNAESDGGAKRAEDIQGGDSWLDDDEYSPCVELWDIWLPMENRFITMPFEDIDGCILRDVPWEGPESGPYHLLSFNLVPNNIMPLSPIGIIYDLHDYANFAYRKISAQAERQKSILAVPPDALKDGEKIVETSDGDTITMQNPKAAMEISFGGVDQQAFIFLLNAVQNFSKHAGNLDMLGGLSPMSETATQDAALLQSASRRMADMQEAMVGFTATVIKDLAWYLITDPLINLPLVKRVKGTDIEVPVSFSSETMEGDFIDYNFSIEPYSMQRPSPAARAQAINTLMQNYVLPMQPYLAQQGIGVNFEKLLRLFGEYNNIDDLDEILTFTQPTNAPGPVGNQPPKPAATQRTIVRVNRPGATNEGTSNILMQALGGGGVNEGQAAAIGRQTG